MHLKSFLSLAVVLAGLPAAAQTRFTAADYARAEKFMTYNTTPLVFHSGVRPSWISGERFYYRDTGADGSEFILVDPAKGTRQPAFDHAKLASALGAASGATISASRLPFQEIDVTPDGLSVSFNYSGRRYQCDTRATNAAILARRRHPRAAGVEAAAGAAEAEREGATNRSRPIRNAPS